MHKVITMCSRDYFEYGEWFLKTRNKVDAQFICYGPDLTERQQAILKSNNIKYRVVDQGLFDKKMQFLKFIAMMEQVDESLNGDLIIFCDWDTFFVNNITQVANKYDFDLGITYRRDMVERDCKRAFANGGVIIGRNNPAFVSLIQFAYKCIKQYGHKGFPEYDEVWKTLEEGRKPEKTHKRTNLRWWVDQVFLSSLALKHIKEIKSNSIHSGSLYFANARIKFLSCDKYNFIDASPNLMDAYDLKGVYIGHMKNNTGAPSNLKDG